MTMTRKLARFSVPFTHSQILAYDSSVDSPQCSWTKDESRRGFTHRDSDVCFVTLLDGGEAIVTVYLGPYMANKNYLRAVAVPFCTPTGRVIVSGVLETHCARLVFVPSGLYMLYCAQGLLDEESEDDRQFIDLYFNQLKEPAIQSQIILPGEHQEKGETKESGVDSGSGRS
jgi:hypothetical protein